MKTRLIVTLKSGLEKQHAVDWDELTTLTLFAWNAEALAKADKNVIAVGPLAVYNPKEVAGITLLGYADEVQGAKRIGFTLPSER